MSPEEERLRALLDDHQAAIAEGKRQREMLDKRLRDVSLFGEIACHLALYMSRDDQPPPPLVARFYRALRDVDESSASASRAMLRELDDQDDAYAGDVLALLADDDWWSSP